MPMFVAPLAGLYSDRIGSRPLMFTGLALQATALGWLASVASPTVAYSSLVIPFVLAGIGMALVFAPVSNMILSSVARSDEGKASGANNAIRQIGAHSAWPCSPACSVVRARRSPARGSSRPRACCLDRSRRARRRGIARPGGAGPPRHAARRHGGRFARRPRTQSWRWISAHFVSTNGALAFPASPGTRARSANWPGCKMANELAKLPEAST